MRGHDRRAAVPRLPPNDPRMTVCCTPIRTQGNLILNTDDGRLGTIDLGGHAHAPPRDAGQVAVNPRWRSATVTARRGAGALAGMGTCRILRRGLLPGGRLPPASEAAPASRDVQSGTVRRWPPRLSAHRAYGMPAEMSMMTARPCSTLDQATMHLGPELPQKPGQRQRDPDQRAFLVRSAGGRRRDRDVKEFTSQLPAGPTGSWIPWPKASSGSGSMRWTRRDRTLSSNASPTDHAAHHRGDDPGSGADDAGASSTAQLSDIRRSRWCSSLAVVAGGVAGRVDRPGLTARWPRLTDEPTVDNCGPGR